LDSGLDLKIQAGKKAEQGAARNATASKIWRRIVMYGGLDEKEKEEEKKQIKKG